jgi:hypothetical protein
MKKYCILSETFFLCIILMSDVQLLMKPQHAKKMARQLAKGKGFVVKPDMMGDGFFDTVGSLLKNKAVKSIVGNVVAPMAAQMLTQSGNPMAGAVVGSVGKAYGSSGSGFLGNVRRAASSKLARDIVKTAMPTLVNEVSKRSNLAGNLTQAVGDSYTSGQGISKVKAHQQSYQSLGGVPGPPVDMKAKMAHIRSFRGSGKKGGSMIAI